MEEVEYNEVTLKLQSGDILVLFTDGIVEAKNPQEELFGFERLETLVRSLSQEMSAKELVNALCAEAMRFTGVAKQYDDMTVVVVKVK
jgi:sigma-B regulation protein RsbU (phosphoserine phosphatase)